MKTKPENLLDGNFATTPDLLLGILHDFWLSRAPSLEGTAIDGLQFEPSESDEYFSRIYIKKGPKNFGIIANIDLRRLNDNSIKVTIPSDLTWYRGEEWDNISTEINQFLLDFASYLIELFSDTSENVRNYSLDVKQTINQVEAQTGTEQNGAGEDKAVLPSTIKAKNIDTLNFGKSCKELYRDFSEGKAYEILGAIPGAWQDYQSEPTPGGWGPRWVAKKLYGVPVGTISNHLRVLYKLGARKVDGIKLPYHPKNSHK